MCVCVCVCVFPVQTRGSGRENPCFTLTSGVTSERSCRSHGHGIHSLPRSGLHFTFSRRKNAIKVPPPRPPPLPPPISPWSLPQLIDWHSFKNAFLEVVATASHHQGPTYYGILYVVNVLFQPWERRLVLLDEKNHYSS